MPASVLIADDDPNIVLALRFLMEKAGYRVRAAGDGPSAVAALNEERPDVVLLDVMMPGLNGYDVCAEIRADSRFDATRIVMLTAKGLDAERSRGLGLGADLYVTKPFSTKEVLAKVRALLAGGRGRDG